LILEPESGLQVVDAGRKLEASTKRTFASTRVSLNRHESKIIHLHDFLGLPTRPASEDLRRRDKGSASLSERKRTVTGEYERILPNSRNS